MKLKKKKTVIFLCLLLTIILFIDFYVHYYRYLNVIVLLYELLC